MLTNRRYENDLEMALDHENRENVLLSDLESGLERIKLQSTLVSSEITNQTQMLESTTKDVDDASTNLEIVDKKIEKILGSNKDNCMIASIILLIILVILFTFLIVYT